MSAEKISIGPWTISAERAPTGKLLIEALLDDVPRARIELDEGGDDESRRRETQSKLEQDMRF